MTEKQLAPLNRQKTIAEEIAERIVLAIASGEQRPGERLTESHVAEVMNVSRVPAREALMNLSAKGILVPVKPRGLRVVDFSDTEVRNIREVRLGLEQIGVRKTQAFVQAEPARLASLAAIVNEMKQLSSSDDFLRLAQCDVRFHREIMRLAQNELLLGIWNNLSAHLTILFCRDWHLNRDKIAEVNGHRKVLKLIETGTRDEIVDVLEAHFT